MFTNQALREYRKEMIIYGTRNPGLDEENKFWQHVTLSRYHNSRTKPLSDIF